MSTEDADGAPGGRLGAVRSSVSSSTTDSSGLPHKHVSPHIGHVDSGEADRYEKWRVEGRLECSGVQLKRL